MFLMKKNILNNREIIIKFVKNNPSATYKDIRKELHIHPERIFKKGMAEIFKEAGIESPRNFDFKNIYKRRELIINFIRKNPKTSTFDINKKLKINVSNTFKSIKEAYKLAGIIYPREKSYQKSPDEKRKEILKIIKENPNITLIEIIKKTQIKNPYRLFKNFEEIYKQANVDRVEPWEKFRIRKKEEILNYIKNNPLSTQREINKNCKTHVQEMFDKGIIEAYEKAGIIYPFERRKIHGTVLKSIKKRAKNFEDEIANRLSKFGTLNKLVKTKRGIADIILERKDKKIPVEIKDYQLKEISISQIKQLNKYMEDISSDIGILICHKKPERDRFLIGKKQIFVLEKQELHKIPGILGGHSSMSEHEPPELEMGVKFPLSPF